MRRPEPTCELSGIAIPSCADSLAGHGWAPEAKLADAGWHSLMAIGAA